MPTWSRRRTRSLAEAVGQFLDGLAAHPEIRRRLRPHGYTEQAHRELQACLAAVGEDEAEGDVDASPGSLWGTARAVGGWVAEQMATATRAAAKLPDVAEEAADALFGSEDPGEAVVQSRKLWHRMRDDEHLSHFFTLAGLRDAGAELSQRLAEGGAPQARSRREQARAELAFLFARWRHACLRELGSEPALLAALGFEASGR